MSNCHTCSAFLAWQCTAVSLTDDLLSFGSIFLPRRFMGFGLHGVAFTFVDKTKPAACIMYDTRAPLLVVSRLCRSCSCSFSFSFLIFFFPEHLARGTGDREPVLQRRAFLVLLPGAAQQTHVRHDQRERGRSRRRVSCVPCAVKFSSFGHNKCLFRERRVRAHEE